MVVNGTAILHVVVENLGLGRLKSMEHAVLQSSMPIYYIQPWNSRQCVLTKVHEMFIFVMLRVERYNI
jgi:hypothetical protein